MKQVTPKRDNAEVGDDTELDAEVPFDSRANTPFDSRPRAPHVTIPTPPPLQPIGLEEVEIVVGSILGDYRVESKLGAGGMGDVYLGVHQLIGKRAAIKVLKSDLCTDPFSVERFIAEARVVNEIGNPNIVDVFSFGQTVDGRSFLVMELLVGETLRERIARGPLDLPEMTQIMRPLVRALGAAHAHGVVHRDLKPDNVFLVAKPGEPPAVKLLDFGIAKLATFAPQMQQTATGALVGTPMYIAPEQARAQAIDHRADIYTLGGMLFEMVTGRTPFVAETSFEVVAKHLMEPPEHPSSIVSTVPPELDSLIVDMLAKTPESRPTLEKIRAVIEGIADPSKRITTPVAVERESYTSIFITEKRTPSPAVVSTSRTRPRSKTLPIVIIAAAVMIVVVLSIVLAAKTRSEAAAPLDAAAIVVTPPMVTRRVDASVVTPDAFEAAIVIDASVPPQDARRTTPKPQVRPHPVPQHVEPAGTGSSGSGTSDETLIPRGSVPR